MDAQLELNDTEKAILAVLAEYQTLKSPKIGLKIDLSQKRKTKPGKGGHYCTAKSTRWHLCKTNTSKTTY